MQYIWYKYRPETTNSPSRCPHFIRFSALPFTSSATQVTKKAFCLPSVMTSSLFCGDTWMPVFSHRLFYAPTRTISSGCLMLHGDVADLSCQVPVQHYCDAIMGIVASQITSLTIVYTTVYSDADQSKHQSCASLAFVWGIHRGPVNSPHKWPVTRKMFPFDDVIMGRLASQELIWYLGTNLVQIWHTVLNIHTIALEDVFCSNCF